MPKVQQKVIIYRHGIVPQAVNGRIRIKKFLDDQEQRKTDGQKACPRCGIYLKDISHLHYVDFKNKIRCIDKEKYGF